jgi:hypothetical protein
MLYRKVAIPRSVLLDDKLDPVVYYQIRPSLRYGQYFDFGLECNFAEMGQACSFDCRRLWKRSNTALEFAI